MTSCARRCALAVCVAAAVFRSHVGWAEEPQQSAASPAAASARRPVPDYDGRGPAPTTAGDVAIWVPRVVLSPLYFTTEFLIRRPLGALVSAAERANLPTILYNFFTFGPDHKAGFAPIAFVDFGFNPSVGVYVFWDDAGFKGNDLRFHGEIWPSDWIAGSLTQRIHFHETDTLTLKVSGIRRPDYVFYGVGPNTLEGYRSRYGADHVNASAILDLALWRASRVQAGMGLRDVNIYHGHYANDPSVEQQAAAGVFQLPYGFDRGYTAEYNHIVAALDNRRPRPAPGSGVRIAAEAEQGIDLRRSPGSEWVRYGGSAGGFVDLDGHNRVASLSVTAMFADPLGNQRIPFTEQVALGGAGSMRGFYPGRLVGPSAAVATLHYRWPIWAWLDGSLQGAVGNVFGDHLKDFRPGLLRFSGAVGVESVGSPDSSLEILVGFGTETFDHGGQVDSIRVVFGTNHGF